MFDDDTGEALNPAARKLVREALAADELALEANGGAAPELGPILSSIPVVDCAEGTYKYVQVQLSHPDEPGTQLLVVRSYATCRYHAENYMKLMRILRADERTRGVVGRVIGGAEYDSTRRRRRPRARCTAIPKRSDASRGATRRPPRSFEPTARDSRT